MCHASSVLHTLPISLAVCAYKKQQYAYSFTHCNPCVVVADGTTADAEPTVAFVRDIVSGMGEVRDVYLYRNLVAKPEGKKPHS
jgi:hypothetical protein